MNIKSVKTVINKVILTIIGLSFFYSCATVEPDFDTKKFQDDVAFVRQGDSLFYAYGPNKLQKNAEGWWEMYLEGDAYSRGIANGILSKELIYNQENAFVSQIKTLVPSEKKIKILQKFLNYYNHGIEKYIPLEYKEEIYGMTRSSSDQFNFVAPPYARTLYFHGAHDIGHAMQDLALVGCTSFALWNERTYDQKLLVGRNFDFYAGEAFNDQKMVIFINPSKGLKHAFVSWPGMIGVTSGLNEAGISLTINAGKSSIPLKAKEPITLVTREILQYAHNLDEAIKIAKEKKVFVSESIMVSSKADNKAILIEISPKNLDLYESDINGELICTNHFQGEAYAADKRNKKAIKNSHSNYRYQKMQELLSKNAPYSPKDAAQILRSTSGLDNDKIGYGNEKAINQLLAHHSVIFQPSDLKMWVSNNDYTLGEYICYDLNQVFKKFPTIDKNTVISETGKNLAEDPFLKSQAYANYEKYKARKKTLQELENLDNYNISLAQWNSWIDLNPDFYEGYKMAADYFYSHKNYENALALYQEALTKEITTLPEKETIKKLAKKAKRKLK